MVGSAPTAKRYRDHALKIREAARDMVRSDSKAGLLAIALDYEHLATSIESAATRRKHVESFS